MDWGVYLVTGRELLPPGKDYLESLDESLRDGHVSVVQIRYACETYAGKNMPTMTSFWLSLGPP